jgi:UDP-glucose 4-epimerase
MLKHQHATARKPDRVVVIGAGGFVGGTIAQNLRGQAVETLTLTRRELDLLQPDAASRLKQQLRPTDSVVMVSARAPAKTVAMLMENLRMVEPVCEALAAAPVAHLIYVSSDAIYADEANPVNERSPAAPSTLHGMMHAARELMLKSSTQAPVAFLRPTLIYGSGDPHSGYGPNRFRREAAKGGPVQIFGEGVAVEDVAELASLILHHRSVGALNAATGISRPFGEIAHVVAEQFGTQIRVVSLPRSGPPPHLMHRHFDITACLKAFPGFHFIALSEGLDRARQQSRGS